MASTIRSRLVILIKNIYIYFMGSETLPSACYTVSDESSIPFYSTSPTNLVYPFTLRVPTNLVYPFTLRVMGCLVPVL